MLRVLLGVMRRIKGVVCNYIELKGFWCVFDMIYPFSRTNVSKDDGWCCFQILILGI